MVELLCPHTLEQAYLMARKQEVMLESVQRLNKPAPKPTNTWQKDHKPDGMKMDRIEHKEKNLPVRRLSREELDVRRRKGLCFNCDEVYSYGHQCKKLFVIIMEDDGASSSSRAEEVTILTGEDDLNCGVSLHALKGHMPTGTIKLAGKVNNNQVVIFVDSGSTHSFLDPVAARRLNCEVEVIHYKYMWLVEEILNATQNALI